MKRLVLLFALVLALPALAASGTEALDAQRAQATAARSAMKQARADQLAKSNELSQLSSRIQTLKASAKGKLLPGSELDTALKQSQDLSDQLTSLAQAVSTHESELEQANLALLSSLDARMADLRAQFDRAADHDARAKAIAQMKTVKAEREQVRASLPASRVPALPALRDSDDPTELLEQVDQLRDEQDKVQARLKQLDGRITEAKAERDLDRRMKQFNREESLFDDGDRRTRMRRDVTQQPVADANLNNPTTGFTPVTTTTVGNPASPQAPFSALGTDKAATGGDNSPTHTVTTAADGRPSVGKTRIAGGDEDDDLDDLEAQRLRLNGLQAELKARAQALQKKAAELK